MKTYILYHANCQDGMGAAYAAWKKFGDNKNVHYIPVHYGSPAFKMDEGSMVYVLDFSFKRDILIDLKSKMTRVVVIDHHKDAMEQLQGLDDVVFDNNHSGAVLSWKYFHENEPVPHVLLTIEDRDLWKFNFPETNYVSKGIKVSIEDFRELDQYAQSKESCGHLVAIGQQADFFDQKEIERSIYKVNYWYNETLGLKFAVGNVNNLISEIGNHLCKTLDVHCSVTYFITNQNKVVFNLRSIGDVDVSIIARNYGGNGHKNASGFNMPLEEGLKVIAYWSKQGIALTKYNIHQFLKDKDSISTAVKTN